MSKIYAQLNSDNVCTSITQYEQALTNPPSNYKEVDSFDQSITGKKWNGSSWEVVPVPEASAEAQVFTAREWRDIELLRTDILVLVPDHPNASSLLTYRTDLRNWPSTSDFPTTKPILGD